MPPNVKNMIWWSILQTSPNEKKKKKAVILKHDTTITGNEKESCLTLLRLAINDTVQANVALDE